MVSGLSDDYSDVLALVDDSVVRGDGNEGATAVKDYKRWSVSRGDSPLRPLDPLLTTLAQKRNEQLRVARFAVFLVQVKGVSAKSAKAYLS